MSGHTSRGRPCPVSGQAAAPGRRGRRGGARGRQAAAAARTRSDLRYAHARGLGAAHTLGDSGPRAPLGDSGPHARSNSGPGAVGAGAIHPVNPLPVQSWNPRVVGATGPGWSPWCPVSGQLSPTGRGAWARARTGHGHVGTDTGTGTDATRTHATHGPGHRPARTHGGARTVGGPRTHGGARTVGGPRTHGVGRTHGRRYAHARSAARTGRGCAAFLL